MSSSPFPTRLLSSAFAISTWNLSKYYGWQAALKDVGLQVPEGAVYLLVGPNGAGKSTAIKILLDLVRPSGGSAEVFGVDVHQEASLIHANVGYVPEQLDWGYDWMRVGRLMEHHARYFPSWDREYAAQLAEVFDLRLDVRLSALSKGQSRRVHIALALAHRPPLLIMDEPTDGFDPMMRDDTLGILSEHLADTPTTVLMTTHHVSEVEQLADYFGVMRNGELIVQVSTSDLRQRLRRYRAEIPDGWNGGSLFGESVMRRTTSHSELDWTVWGDESRVAGELVAAGATVRDVGVLSLEEATRALFTPKRHVK